MKADSIGFERFYSDGSGVELAVRLLPERGDCYERIEIEHINKVTLPIGDLSWVIDALVRVRNEVVIQEPPHE